MQPRNGRSGLASALATPVLLCVAAVTARVIVGGHITDDAYITMRYSRNLAASGSMSYNPPDAVLGTSTPLWTWILAAGDAVGIAPETTAVVAASAADVCSIVLILTSPAGSTLAAIGAAATIAAWPAYVMYAVSGMETSLYVLTIVGFISALSRQRSGLAAIAASLAFLCRPDGGLLVVLGFVWTLFAGSPTAALRFACSAVLICAPWMVYAFARFGSIVPASVTAKAAASDPWFLGLQNLHAYFFQGIYVPVTLLAIAGFVTIAKNGDTQLFAKTNSPQKVECPRFWLIWSVWAWAYLTGMTAANAFTHFPWYFVPLLPIYIGSAVLALDAAASRFLGGGQISIFQLRGQGLENRDLTPVRAAVAAVLAAALLARMPPLKSYLDETAAGREVLYASVATQLAGIDARCTIAATEIGTIGYHYPGRVLDLVGLVSPEVVGRQLDVVLAESRARWLVTYDTHFARTVAGTASFSNLFERRSTVRVSDTRTLEIYERRDRSGCGMP